jgi:aldose 1-epimerase
LTADWKEVPIPPSGEQFELRHDDQVVTVVEVGGGLRSYRRGDWEVLDGYGVSEMCSSGRGQILVPWPNRVDRGRYEFDGADLQLPLTEPEQQNAIHGLARWAAWTAVEREAAHVALEHVVQAQAGYPFSVHVRLDYRLGPGGLEVALTATNIGAATCPFGAGAHPYVKVGDGLIDDGLLEVKAATWYETNERQIPTGRAAVSGSRFDFHTERAIAGTVIDTAFTDLERDAAGRAWVNLRSADGTRSVRLWLDSGYGYLMLFTGDTLPDKARRRHGLGIEPMTCAPNAFASGDGLRVLAPGESLSTAWGIEAQQA